MKKTFLADPVKTGIAGVFSLFLLVLLPEFIRQQNTVGALVFGAIFLIFAGITIYAARLVQVDQKEMCVSYFGLFKRHYPWDELQEVGVMGLRIFKSKKSKASGLTYIYFSKEALTDDERFNIALRWPVNHIPYLLYNRKRLETIQFLWEKPISFYNADSAKFEYK